MRLAVHAITMFHTPPAIVDLDGSTSPVAIPLGSVLGDRYRVDELIGRGGMGLVYRGHQLDLDATVAIKFIRPELVSDPNIVARFIDEAQITASARNDRVVRMLDLGRRSNGDPFIVLEFLEGTDLESVLATHGSLSIASTLAYSIDVCAGLAAVHRQSVVHRDIKPANLGIVPSSPGEPGHVKILDFGIAERREAFRPSPAASPTFAHGSPHHMSPEQFTGSVAVDARSDIWSLGVVIYQMLVGRLPFVGDDVLAICARVLSHDPDEPSSVRDEVPRDLSRLVMRCLRKDPEDRPAAISFVESELRRIRKRVEQPPRSNDEREPNRRDSQPADLRGDTTVRLAPLSPRG